MTIVPPHDADPPIVGGGGESRAAADSDGGGEQSPFHAGLADSFRGQVEPNELYAATPGRLSPVQSFWVMDGDGTPVRVSPNETVHDYAYRRGLWIGHGAQFALVDGREVDMRKKTEVLEPGQTVEIRWVAVQGSPERNWGYHDPVYLHHERYRMLVRGFHHELAPRDRVILGSLQLDDAIRWTERESGVLISPMAAAQLAGFESVDDLQMMLGGARYDPYDLAARLTARIRIEEGSWMEATPEFSVVAFSTDGRGRESMRDSIIVHGQLGRHKRIPKCCDGLSYGDPIVGYAGRRRGVAVHLADCRNLAAVEKPHRLVSLSWGQEESRFVVGGDNRVGLDAYVLGISELFSSDFLMIKLIDRVDSLASSSNVV